MASIESMESFTNSYKWNPIKWKFFSSFQLLQFYHSIRISRISKRLFFNVRTTYVFERIFATASKCFNGETILPPLYRQSLPSDEILFEIVALVKYKIFTFIYIEIEKFSWTVYIYFTILTIVRNCSWPSFEVVNLWTGSRCSYSFTELHTKFHKILKP